MNSISNKQFYPLHPRYFRYLNWVLLSIFDKFDARFYCAKNVISLTSMHTGWKILIKSEKKDPIKKDLKHLGVS
jgi:hypothetical protein